MIVYIFCQFLYSISSSNFVLDSRVKKHCKFLARCDPHAEGGERFLAPENGSASKMDPKMVFFSQGIPPKMAETFRLRIFIFAQMYGATRGEFVGG